jgi:Uma2 family endonuclease
MTSLAKARATYADIEALPKNLTGEIINGDLYVSPRPAGPHATAASVLIMDIGSAFHRGRGGPGGWLILDEPELHLGSNVMVPDIAGWRRERLAEAPNDHRFTVAPDWVCEVLSPNNASYDRIKKMHAYQRAGVQWAWLLDPLERTLEVFRNSSDHWLVEQSFAAALGDERARIPPFEAVELELAALWPAAKRAQT